MSEPATQKPSPGDVLLLCRDGLHGPLGHEGLAAVLNCSTADRHQTAAALIEAANAAGGPDNITAVLVHINRTGASLRPHTIVTPVA